MDNKTKIKFTRDCVRYKSGETGYIDGYIMGMNNVACAVVVKDNDNRVILADLDDFVKI